MKLLKQYLSGLLICCAVFNLSAQSIRGIVIDPNQRALSDVLVYSKGGQIHSHTLLNGTFQLSGLQASDTLFFQRLGYANLRYIIQSADLSEELIVTMESAPIDLKQVDISLPANPLQQIIQLDISKRPLNNSQELLRKVPGLFIGQHAGGGKAEQIFLRGFDIDHGTDVQLSVDGMPVNMVSHAHGQGYADLHFLIPETIEKIDFNKGPYEAEQGNFSTAGSVRFTTKDQLEQSSFGIEYGDFNHFRTFGLFDLLKNTNGQNAYLASEFFLQDGPFESPQQFYRFNLMGKYQLQLKELDKLKVGFSHFRSQWNASGQIPQRLVDRGLISRFGSVDDTEGGFTGRSNLNLQYHKSIGSNSFLKTQAYFSRYDFKLYSNFTFFLEDPENGDQIKQEEIRDLFGITSSLNQQINPHLAIQAGAGFRMDDVKGSGLASTRNRDEVLGQISFGDIQEWNAFSYMNATINAGRWRFVPSIRADLFHFAYQNRLENTRTSTERRAVRISPKLQAFFQASDQWQLYLKTGQGFHSNDSRIITAREADLPLPSAYGVDLGSTWKPTNNLWLHFALWALDSEQEFKYVGDAGIVEPSGRSRRQGFDLGLRYQLSPSLYINGDLNYAKARFRDLPKGENYVPLAPSFTSTGEITYQKKDGWSASLAYRYLNQRPANEDNSIQANGYFLVDANVSYPIGRLRLGLSAENIFNQEWEEAQFATESRLREELTSVEEIHFTPGVPFFLKVNLQYAF